MPKTKKNPLLEKGPVAILRMFEDLQDDYSSSSATENTELDSSEHFESSSFVQNEDNELKQVRKEVLRRLKIFEQLRKSRKRKLVKKRKTR